MVRSVVSVPALTADEFAFALGSGGAVYDGRMHSPPLSETTRPVEIEGHTVTLADIPINRAAIAILESLKHDPEKAKAALYRIVMIAVGALNHPDVAPWKRVGPDGRKEYAGPLIEAIATIPANYSNQVSPARVFEFARKIARSRRKWAEYDRRTQPNGPTKSSSPAPLSRGF